MKVEVHYQTREAGPAFAHVATVDVPEDVAKDGVEAALEYAWRWTQNIEGSWSKAQWSEDAHNPDWNAFVEVVKPIRIFQGQHLGHRSSMVGDHFVIDGRTYVAAPFGFEG